jgi:protein ImuB
MPVNAALALSPHLDARPREPAAELDTLHGLAAWATRFTPLVSVEPGGALLLEVAASARLFGGIEALRAEAVAGTIDRGHAVLGAVAPTARAALWLARSRQEVLVTDIARLPGVLARLPVSRAGWPLPVRQALHRMGVRRLGECMRLPRDGLRRRLEGSCLEQLDEALGRRPELRRFFSPAERFRDELELPAESRETAMVVEALRILLGRLGHYLRSRQRGAWIFWIGLRHHRRPATLLRIGLLRPSADVRHLGQLAAIQLSALVIPAPVLSVALTADVADASPPAGEDLIGQLPDPGARVAQFVERLRTRLGLRAVHGIGTCSDHRPEHAWQAVADPLARRLPGTGPAASSAPRPLWVLGQPVALHERSGTPFFRGPLALDSGPERIETGWWDGRDVRRDYYVARNPRGMRTWIFRDRRAERWYLHGLFG